MEKVQKLTLAFIALITLMATSLKADSLSDIPFKTIDGKETSLKAYEGKVVLIVNVASRCGHTKQYTGLEQLYKDLSAQGLVILGFPCNDFGAQEPGTNEEIQQFCSSTYNVTFPLMDKIHVKGPEQAPLYAALTGPTAKFPGNVKWNFGKFLINRQGEVIARFEPGVKPEDTDLQAAIKAALAN